jgi:hypothetical protein
MLSEAFRGWKGPHNRIKPVSSMSINLFIIGVQILKPKENNYPIQKKYFIIY